MYNSMGSLGLLSDARSGWSCARQAERSVVVLIPVIRPLTCCSRRANGRSNSCIRAVSSPTQPSRKARRKDRTLDEQHHNQVPLADAGPPQKLQQATQEVSKKASDLINSPTVAMLALNLGAVLFGSNQVVIKTVEHDLSPNSLSALRFLIAAVVFSPLAAKGLKNAGLRLAALELGTWLFLGYTAQVLGLEYTTAAKGAFTGTFTVLAVPLLVGFSGRKVPLTTWASALVALVGVGLLTTGGGGFTWGDALCIFSAVLFGVHKFRTETVTDQFKNETQELVAAQLFIVAVISSLVCVPELIDVVHGRSPGEVFELATELPWPALAYMGLGTTALTLWIEMSALKQVSAPLAALIYTSEPLWGAMFAWVLLDERWGSTGWIGAFLIVASSLAAQFSGQDAKPQDLNPAKDS